jgi:hypothetical protein
LRKIGAGEGIRTLDPDLGKVKDLEATKRLASITGDVGQYLYGSGRCAVAHAGGTPTADPENPEDMARLQDDLPIVRALAEIAIEAHFGVKSRATVFGEHPYELEGFKEIFGADRVSSLKNIIGTLPPADWPALPKLNIRLEGHDTFEPLENMMAEIKDIVSGLVVVQCTSPTGLAKMVLGLNFKEERLQLDPEEGMRCADNGTALAARCYGYILRFRLGYLMNGALEV